MSFLESNNHEKELTDIENESMGSTQNTATSSTRNTSRASWCRNVASKRKSLMYSEDDTRHFGFINTSADASNPRDESVKATTLFNIGHGYGSVLIDTTGQNELRTELLQLIADQYPSRTGVVFRKDATTRFAELNFNTNDPALDTILEKGLVFHNQSITIACKALHYDKSIVYVSLYHLPLATENLLLNELKAALSWCGYVLDIGILVEPITNTYMCSGYAIIDTKYNAAETLKHIIQLDSYSKNNSYAVWNDMPDYCQRCHQQDHVTDNCPKYTRVHIYNDSVLLNSQDHNIQEKDDDFIKYTLFALKKGREYIDIGVKTSNSVNLWFRK